MQNKPLFGGRMAACLSSAIHLGLLLWLGYRPSGVAEPLPQAAIMLQQAPQPVAQNTTRNEVSPDLRQSLASQARQPSVTPQPSGATLPVNERATLTVPKRTRTAATHARAKAKTAPHPPQPQSSQAAADKVRAQAQTTSANMTAAPQSVAGSVSSPQARISWVSRLMAHLEKFKRYPGRETGTVVIRFTLDDTGNVLSYTLVSSSGSAALDRAALSMVQRASPVPAPPPGMQKTITAPVSFTLEH